MSLLLNVPYIEKDEAKALGARWNPELKKWYVTEQEKYPLFKKWILNNEYDKFIICDKVYAICGKRKCFKCKKEVTAIGFGFKKLITISSNKGYVRNPKDKLMLCAFFDPMPKKLLEFAQSKCKYEMRYSKTIENSYYASVCPKCGMIQGRFFLFNEPGQSPFSEYTLSKPDAQLEIYECQLEYDLIIDDYEEGDIQYVPFKEEWKREGVQIKCSKSP